jgi:hypothetical protein
MRFAGANAKVSRAHVHLQTLDDEIKAFFGSYQHPIGGHYNAETAEITLYALGHDQVPLIDWGIRVGDCLHNLRSALDHVAWQFALAHLGREPSESEARKIPFPLEDTPGGFATAAVRKFLSDDHIRYVDFFQPYKEGDKAKQHKLSILRRLSNLDKHRVVPAATLTPEGVDLTFPESSDIGSYESIELYLGEPMKKDTPIGRIGGVATTGPNPKVNAEGPIQFGVVFDYIDDPVLHRQGIVGLLGKLGEMVDSVVSTAEVAFAPPPTHGETSPSKG